MSEYKTINLSNVKKISDDGSFHCPICNNLISPDDDTEESYEILDVKLSDDKDYVLREITLLCVKCKTKIKLLNRWKTMAKLINNITIRCPKCRGKISSLAIRNYINEEGNIVRFINYPRCGITSILEIVKV